MLRLVQEFGAHAGRSLEFHVARVRIGRAPDNDVVFDAQLDLDASGHHCELTLVDGRWSVTDRNARTGTWVNGQRVGGAPHPLAHGDVLECGRNGPRLRVELAPAPTVAVPAFVPVPPSLHGAPAPPPPAAPPPHAPVERAVGHRTVALMIEQAVAQSTKRQRGLRAAVVILSALLVVGVTVSGWLLYRSTEPAVPSPSDANLGARIAQANGRSIYLVAARQRDGRTRGFCTAFAVTSRLLATNAHCVRAALTEAQSGGQTVVLRNKESGVAVAATAVYADARFQDARFSRGGVGYDVGLLRAAEELPTWVALADDAELHALHEGDGIFVYGFPGLTVNEASPVATITLGLLNRVTDFSDNVGTPQTAQKLQHSAQTSGGSSGSPIFLPSGRVIGLNAGSLADDERQIVVDPSNGQRREVAVNRSSNFKYGMRADLIRQALAAVAR
ncbi:MAG: trypsin-like peptidase domain-containing protein [Polyangiales bacterium]